MKNFNRVLYAFILIVIISCSPKLSPDYGWDNKRWILVELKEVPVQLSGGSRDAYIEFFPGEKRFSGNAGCNHITGNYTLEKNEITFRDVVSTKMACPDLPFETTFLQSLGEVNRYEITDDVMLLKDNSKVLLMFRPR